MWFADVSVQLAPDQGLVPADHPTELRRRCEEEAQQMVQMSNLRKDGPQIVTNPSFTHLISRLTALLLQIKVCMLEYTECPHWVSVELLSLGNVALYLWLFVSGTPMC